MTILTPTEVDALEAHYPNKEKSADIHALIATLRAEQEKVERLRATMQGLLDCVVAMQFEPDPGQPHPVKDGVYDKWIAKARAALALVRP